jgi:hypothetical protein
MRSLNDSHDFRPFFNTMLWCAEGRHEPKQIAEWIRESPFPIDAVRDHLAYALAIATLEGITDRGDLDTQTEAFVRDQREAARQYARLLIELYPIGDEREHRL